MRFCKFCDEALWPDPPKTMVVTNNRAYCNERHEQRDRLVRRRDRYDEPRYRHDCDTCGRWMFTPAWESGWYCPECDATEKIDTSYWEWWKDTHNIVGNGSWEFQPKCPDCSGHTYLFDGALQCHDCDLWITQYNHVWWAFLESEYPSKQHKLTEQTKLWD